MDKDHSASVVQIDELALDKECIKLPAQVLKFAWELLYLSSDLPQDRRSLRLLLGPLKWLHVWRFTLGLFGIAAVLLEPVAGFPLMILGEFMERHLFFRAAAAWKMPGHA